MSKILFVMPSGAGPGDRGGGLFTGHDLGANVDNVCNKTGSMNNNPNDSVSKDFNHF